MSYLPVLTQGRFSIGSICFAVLTLSLSLSLSQDVGVLSQPAERQFFSGEDSSGAETTESHQPSAK